MLARLPSGMRDFEIGALLRCIHNAAGQRRVDERRTNAVDPDPMRRQFDRHGLGQAFDGVFRHAVDGAIGGSDMTHLRRNVDDCAAPLRAVRSLRASSGRRPGRPRTAR